jgi:hypothetical protein
MTRRFFLQALGSASAPATGAFYASRAQAAETDPSIRFSPDLEPIVRLIEETPRDKCVGVLAGQVRAGLPYRRFLSAVFLAALRKQDSHHSVYLVNSAHQVSLDLNSKDRLIPLFWALDHFKWDQDRFPMPAVRPITGALPSTEKAGSEFHEAMRASDEERAGRAIAAWARGGDARRAFDTLWQYGCRDMSLIGHRAISVTSCWRTLETIGWQEAEPVLRFVVRNLIGSKGAPDRYYHPNLERVEKALDKLPAGWLVGGADAGTTLELFALLRQGQSEAACELAVKQLEGVFGAQPLWDALHIAAAELLILHPASSGMAMRPLHTNTTVNALHFAYNASAAPGVRLLILLQATAWVGAFIRAHLGEQRLAETKPVDLGGVRPDAPGEEAVQDLFEQLPPRIYDHTPKTPGGYLHINRQDRAELGRKVFALVNQDTANAARYMQAARSWLCVKAAFEAHEVKLPPALFEDYELVSPQWRARLLAASAHWLHGSQSPDSQLLQEVRQEIQDL